MVCFDRKSHTNRFSPLSNNLCLISALGSSMDMDISPMDPLWISLSNWKDFLNYLTHLTGVFYELFMTSTYFSSLDLICKHNDRCAPLLPYHHPKVSKALWDWSLSSDICRRKRRQFL